MTAPLPPAFVQPALVQAAPDSAQPLTQPVGEPPPRRSHKTLTVDIHQAMGSATPFVQPGQAPPATHSTMPAPAPPAASAPPPVATITAPPYAGAVPTSPAPPMGPAAAPIAPTAPPPVVQGASPQAAARPPSSPQAAPPPVGLAGGPGPQRINPKLMGTMNTTLDAMREPAMPFAPAAAGAPARKETNDAPSPKTVGTPFDAGARPPAEMRVASLSETMSSLDDDDDEPRTKMIDGAMAAAVAGAAERPLPFGQTTPDPATRTLDAAAVAAIANALERPTPFGGPPPHQNHQQQGYTKPEGRSPAPTGGLPFAPAKVAPGHDRPSDPGQPPGGLGSSHASSGSHPAVTTGHAGSGTHPAVTGAQAAPAQAQTSGKIFTLNQFASLTAEIAEAPTQVAEIRRKYGVTEAQHHAESQRWTEDFATNSELRQRYFGVVARYRSYLKNKP